MHQLQSIFLPHHKQLLKQGSQCKQTIMNESLLTGLIELITKAETSLPNDVVKALKKALELETNPHAKLQLKTILDNIEVASKSKHPLCQDTGVQTFFITCGFDFPHTGLLKSHLTEAVKRATQKIPLRPNTVEVFSQHTNQDNTGAYMPAITWDFKEGDSASITAMPKGGGSENMSRLIMLKPNQGIEGIKEFVVDQITQAAGNPCPPTVIGLGIGGSADLALKLGKLALIRPLGTRHKDPVVANLEEELKTLLNNTGIGPMGLGGNTTVLDVKIETAPRHPASLPIGLVVQCWADRRATMTISPDMTWRIM